MLNSKVALSLDHANIPDTLIVWTIKTTDMALSFQEGQGCSEIMSGSRFLCRLTIKDVYKYCSGS